jgi:hypothetical protein
MNNAAQLLFEVFDKHLDYVAREIRNETFSLYPDIPWTREQYGVLEPAIRRKLESLVGRLLGDFTNAGSVLPEEAPGYLICDMQTGQSISDNYADYSDMWLDYLLAKKAVRGDQRS